MAVPQNLATTMGPSPSPNPLKAPLPTNAKTEGDDSEQLDLFHSSYRPLSDAESRAMIKIKAAANNLVDEFAIIEPSREKSIAVTKIEEAVMWAVKALTK